MAAVFCGGITSRVVVRRFFSSSTSGTSALSATKLKHNRDQLRTVSSSSSSSSFSSHSTSSSKKQQRTLILYSKPGCCLCDGLKEKLQLAFMIAGSDSLQDVQLQVRDITENSEWEQKYQNEIPVLARVLSDGTEENLPRLSPRLGVEQLHKKLAEALR